MSYAVVKQDERTLSMTSGALLQLLWTPPCQKAEQRTSVCFLMCKRAANV